MSSGHWLAPVFCLLVELQASLAGMCCPRRVMAAHAYGAVTDHALFDHILREVQGTSAAMCLALCLSYHGRCSSVNYNHIQRVCQISDANKDEYIADFRESHNFSYFDIRKDDQCHQQVEQQQRGTTTPAPMQGCSSANDGPMGMTSGLIPDSMLHANAYGDGLRKADIRITGRGWCARFTTPSPWVKVDLGQAFDVTGVYYVGVRIDSLPDSFIVKYSFDSIDNLEQSVQNANETGPAVFDGAPQGVNVTARFPKAVNARYIQLKPPTWDSKVEYSQNGNAFCLQFELLGCR